MAKPTAQELTHSGLALANLILNEIDEHSQSADAISNYKIRRAAIQHLAIAVTDAQSATPNLIWPAIPGAFKIQHPEHGVVYSFARSADAQVAAAGKELREACHRIIESIGPGNVNDKIRDIEPFWDACNFAKGALAKARKGKS